MKSLAYTIPTTKSFDDVVAAIEHNTAAHGFRVLHVHDIAAALAEKGFQREPPQNHRNLQRQIRSRRARERAHRRPHAAVPHRRLPAKR
jgi:hypothetical protein